MICMKTKSIQISSRKDNILEPKKKGHKNMKAQTTIEYVVIAVVVIVAATLAGLYVMSMTSHAHIGASETLDGAMIVTPGSNGIIGIELSTPLPSTTLSLTGSSDLGTPTFKADNLTVGGTYEYEIEVASVSAGDNLTSVTSGTGSAAVTYTTASGSPITLESGSYPFSEGTGLGSS